MCSEGSRNHTRNLSEQVESLCGYYPQKATLINALRIGPDTVNSYSILLAASGQGFSQSLIPGRATTV